MLPRPMRGLLLGAACALLIQSVAVIGWLDGLNRGTLDALFRARGSRFPAPQIVLVVANDETIARYNAWPLPRRVYAELVRHLRRNGAKTIAFDMLFSEPSPRAGDDSALSTACRGAGNVIQAGAFHLENIFNPEPPVGTTTLSAHSTARFTLSENVKTSNAALSSLPSAVWMSTPISGLQQSAPLLGHINVHLQRDGAMRLIPHVIRFRNELYPSLALAAAAHYLEIPAQRITVAPTEILIAGRRLPIEADGETGINWAGGNGTYPTYSISQVLNGQVPRDALQNKIVLIGATAVASYEFRATPFSNLQPAIEVQANALDNILENRPLYFTSPWARFALLLGFALLAGLLIAPRLDLGGTLLLFSLCGVLWLAAWRTLAAYDLYLPIAPPILAALLTYALAMAINYRQEWETNFRADAAVATLARGGALLALGHSRAHAHDVIRTTAREALCADEVLLVLRSSQDELLCTIAEKLNRRHRAVIYPFPRRSSAQEKSFSPDADLEKTLCLLSERLRPEHAASGILPSIVATPIRPSRASISDTGEHLPPITGALIAVGARGMHRFCFRDATLLEMLSEQASLALENLEYSELLRGRVELANQDLSAAYAVLTEQSAKFMAAVESMDGALVLCDATGHAIFVNSDATQTLASATPQLGDMVPALLRAHGLEKIAALFGQIEWHTTQENAAPLRCEVDVHGATLQREDDSPQSKAHTRVLAARLTALYADSHEPIGTLLLVADISAQRELDQMKTDFVSFVAHELRSPLTTILGYASLLEDYADEADPSARRDMTDAITRQCQRLNRLIGDLLDISRLDAGRPLELHRESIRLYEVIRKILDAQRAAQSDDRITFRVTCDNKSLTVWGDPDRFEQILVNLVSNAAKYSPDGGEVLVRLEDCPEGEVSGVTISVCDSGLGLTSEEIAQLFQKYYRASEAREHGIKGTGLGLYLVKNLVEANHGNIRVQSASGQGTTFSVWLPQRGLTGSNSEASDKML